MDPCRPSRKFSAPRPLEETRDEDEIKEKKRLRQERLMAVAEEHTDGSVLEKQRTKREEKK